MQSHLILPLLCMLCAQELTLQLGWAGCHAEGSSAECTLSRASLAAAAAAEEPLG